MSKRLELITKARSVSDILDIVKSIEHDFKKSEEIVSNIVESLSGDEISFDGRKPRPVKVTKIVAPNKKALVKHTQVLDDLYKNVQELDSAEAMIKHSFSNNRKASEALKAITSLKQDIEDKINDAFDALSAIADNHTPHEVQDMADILERTLIKTLNPSSYDDMDKYNYVALGENPNEFQFSTYIGVHGLSDVNGFKHQSFYFVLTALTGKDGVTSFYLNAFPDFKLPGRYPVGKEVSSAVTIEQRANFLIAHNAFETEHKRMVLPIDSKRAETMGIGKLQGVKKVAIQDEQLIVTFEAGITDKKIEKVASDVMARLRSAVGNSNAIRFKYSPGKVQGSKALKFVMVKSDDAGRVNKTPLMSLHQLDEIKIALGLTDAQVKALKSSLQV